MYYLFDEMQLIEKDLLKKQLFLFLDYDGTLTSITDSPEKAVLSEKMKNLLESLSQKRSVKLFIITGRSLSDIKKIITLNNIIYAGNHGIEIEGPGFKYNIFVPLFVKKLIIELSSWFKDNVKEFPGIVIEDKNLAVAIHYRNVDESQVPYIKKMIDQKISMHLEKNRLRLDEGKKVYEIRPAIQWNKGDAVSWLLAKYSNKSCGLMKIKNIVKKVFSFMKNETENKLIENIVPIYIGDDITDENAFKALENKGISVYVGGNKQSAAKYYLNNTDEVFDFLNKIDYSINK